MIVIDFSQVEYACVHSLHSAGMLSEANIRKSLLMRIAGVRGALKLKYGLRTYLCCDSTSWRKQAFPGYKATRKHDDAIPWDTVRPWLSKIECEFDTYLGVGLIKVEGAEGDDCIAEAVRQTHLMEAAAGSDFGGLRTMYDGWDGKPAVIVSNDHDFHQLHAYADQWNPVHGAPIRVADPCGELIEMIIRGDYGDGIPSILSPDDRYTSDAPQRSRMITKAVFAQLVEEFMAGDLSDPEHHWSRNIQLLDLSMTPKSIRTAIAAQFTAQANKRAPDLAEYIMAAHVSEPLELISSLT